MMKKIISPFAYLILLVAVSSCNDDFLNTRSTDFTDDLVWSDPELAETYILNLYTSIRLADKEPDKGERSMGLTRGHHWALWSSISDESIFTNNDQTWIIQQGQLSPSSFGWTSTSWGRNYLGIRECNDALSRIPGLEVSEQKINELMAEVRFIRAVRYFELLRGFGGVPIIGDVVVDLNDNFDDLYIRQSVDSTIAYIENELDIVAEELPILSEQQQGRATREAAIAFKARLLLYAASPLYSTPSVEKWAKAADAADAVIATGTFSLVADLDPSPAENYRLLFLQGETSEDIFMRHFTQNARSFPMEKMNAPNGYTGFGGNCPTQNLVDDYEMSNGLPTDALGSGYDDQNPYLNRDPRFYGTILYNGANYRGREVQAFISESLSEVDGGLDSKQGPQPQNSTLTGYYLRKFMDETSDLNNPGNTGGKTPWRYIRYAEILLSFAEAQNEAQGPNAQGNFGGLTPVQAVNMIRTRAGMPALPLGITQSELRERIRNERRIELAFEEHRYWDVRRWEIAMETGNAPAGQVVITKSVDGSLSYDYTSEVALTGRRFEPRHYWFPIPLDEITKSGNRLEQNNGY